MGFHTGTVTAKNLFSTILSKITQTQPEASAPYWVSESSVPGDAAYTSKGSTGTERIVIRLLEGNVGQYFSVAHAYDYTPGVANVAGSFTNLVNENMYYFTSKQNDDVEVTYHLDVTPDRIIIHVQGDKLISSWQNSVLYVGMPIRYDTTDKKFIVKGQSENSNYSNSITVLENSIGGRNVEYQWYFVNVPNNPSWGGKFFVETFHIGNSTEGLRGELDGLYGAHPNGLVDGDEIDVNGQRYLVIKRRANGNNAFPSECLLLKLG